MVNHQGGAAAVDMDGDGLTDLLFARVNSRPLLYLNQGDGSFVEDGEDRGLAVANDAAGFGAADYDNDGNPDLVVVPHHGPRYYFLVNDGTGNFTDDAEARGAAIPVILQDHEGYSVGIADYDLDGYLDIYVSERGIVADAEKASHSVLLRSVGASAPGTFENVTELAGLVQPVTSDRQQGFSTAWADFDDDGWVDLALIVDYGNSQLY